MRTLFTIICCFMILPCFAQVAVKGKLIYTMSGDLIKDGTILMKDGKIEAVGASLDIPDGYTVHEATIITPGFIDTHTVVGLAGHLNQDHDQDQLERSSPIQPELRAIDAYNPREYLVQWLREHGVTTIHTGHGPGALISGQTMIAKTYGDHVHEAVIKPQAMLAMTLARSAQKRDGKSPGTRAKMMAMLRTKFIKAQEYQAKLAKAEGDKKPARNLAMEALIRALDGELPVMVTVDRAQDILNALRLADEFKLKLVLDSAAEAYLVKEEIKKAGVPVLIHPTMKRTRGDNENLTMEAAALLHKEGIAVTFQSGYEGYVPKTRVVLFEAAIAVANGLPPEQALACLTIDAARLLGIDDRVGSIEVGKDGDLVLFDGNPFEYLTHVTHVFIDGRLVSDKKR